MATPRSSRTGPETAGDVREQLLQAALRQFRQRGFDAVPVSHVTREVGVAKGTFFNHFPTKDHVLAETFRRMVDRSIEEVEARHVAGGEAVMAFSLGLSGQVTRDRNLALALVPRLFVLPALTPEELTQEERIRQWIEARLGEALPLRVPLHQIQHGALASVVAWTLRGTLEDWVRGESRGRGLRSSLEAQISFLLESAGFPVTPSE